MPSGQERERRRSNPTTRVQTDEASFEDTARDMAEQWLVSPTRGGTFIVGVDDKRSGPVAFVGCEFEAEALRRRIEERTSPSVTVTALTVRVGESYLVVLVVPEGLDVHSVLEERATGGQVAWADVSLGAGRLIEERRGLDWSAEPAGRAGAEVSSLALAAARQMLRTYPDRSGRPTAG